VRRPKLLLLDEPLSNLDAKLRERVRIEMRELQRRLRITTVYVTHDQTEALALSREITVMRDGVLVQEGSPRDIYAGPRTGFVADFIGSATFLPGCVAHGGVVALEHLISCSVPASLRPGDAALVVLRPEDVVLRHERGSLANEMPGTVRIAAYLGDHLDCVVEVAGVPVRAKVHPSIELRRDQQVWLELPPERCIVLPDDGWRPQPPTVTFDHEV
jgi:iron(III) transport system ATP-binding protein